AAALVVGVIVAHAGVARSRRGQVPSWAWLSPARSVAKQTSVGKNRRFTTGLQGQTWVGAGRSGLDLPLIVAPVLAISRAPAFLDGLDPRTCLFLLTAALLTPVYIAGLDGGGGKNNPWSRDAYGLPSFIGTRPMTTAELISAKLRAAVRPTLVTWSLVLGS